ncbi:terminase small subunit [Paenibacillus thiaminolyticus]|uniref:terminase small subunit n=2 Tax=Paenibacillus TaxID=44249 RepID=UPI001165B112|nr:terminase small subunit [Paenibacillus thiaminolyticus]NGP62694.1 terminase small subunit [Paenibacillus thiaminolyticus]
MALTAKQKAFVQEYLIDLNATQAAIRAGYSAKTARKIGAENLTKPDIQKAIQEAMERREKRTEITQDRVLQELAKIGFADIKSYLSFRTERAVVGYETVDDEEVPVFGYQDVIELKPSDQVDGAVISEVKHTKEGIAFKLHDKVSALEKIGRHLGMFKDKVEHSGSMDVNNPMKGLTTDELRKLIRDG